MSASIDLLHKLNKKHLVLGFLSILLLGMAACTNELVQGPVDQNSTTGAKISIPLLSPFFNNLLTGESTFGTSSGVRMYAGISSVKISLLDEEDSVVDQKVVNITRDSPVSSGTNEVCTLNALPGNYTVRVEVFNAKNSLDIPVVQGEETVTLTEGTIETVTVDCFPVNPTPLSYEPVVVDLEPSIFEQSVNSRIYGQEQWFSFTATSMIQCFRIIPEDPTANGYYVWIGDSQNNEIASYSPISMANQSEYLMIDTTPGETYYIGCISTDVSYGTFQEALAGSFSIALHHPLLSEIISTTADTMIVGSPAEGVSLVAKEGLSSAGISISYVEEGCTATLNGVAVSGTTANIDLSNEVSVLDISCEIDGTIHTERWYIKTEMAQAIVSSIAYQEVLADGYRFEKTWVYLETNAGVEYVIDNDITYNYNFDTMFYQSGAQTAIPYQTECGHRYYQVIGNEDPLFMAIYSRWSQPDVSSWFRIRPSTANSSPVVEEMDNPLSLTILQTRESLTEGTSFRIIDLDGDTLTVRGSCTQLPPNVSPDQVPFSVSISGSSLYMEMDSFAPAGDYSFLVELDDGQGFDGSDGTNEASVIQIPVNVTVQDISCLARMDVSAFSIATGSTVSVGVTITNDPDLDPDSIELTLAGIPGGSTTALSEPVASVMSGNITATAEFTPDIIGTYFVQFQYTCSGETRTILKQISAYDNTQGGINVTID